MPSDAKRTNRAAAPTLTWVAAAFGLVSFALLLGFSLWGERSADLANARVQAENMSRLMDEHALATVRAADVVLREVQSAVTPADMRAPADARSERLHALLSARLADTPHVAALNIFDRTGTLVYSATAPLPQASIADRAHFRAVRDDAEAGLVLSEPVKARTTGTWSLVLARRLGFEDGSFAGSVNVVLDLQYFGDFYRSLDPGPHGTLVLRDGRLRLLARNPPAEAVMGREIPGHFAAPILQRGLTHAVLEAAGQVDGVDRIYSMRQVGALPLYVFAGIATQDVLADWRSRGKVAGLAALVVAAAVLGLVELGRRGARDAERAMAELQASEARLNDAQSIAHIGSWELDCRTGIVSWSEETRRIFGVDPASATTSLAGLLQAVHPEDRDAVRRGYDDALARHVPLDVTHRILVPDGSPRVVHLRCETAYAADGQPLRTTGTVQDTTENQRAETALRDSEERLRTLADYTYDWEYWEGPNHEILYVSPACERITGYSQREFLAAPQLTFDIIYPPDRPLMQAHVRDSFHEDNTAIDFRIVTKAGELRWIAHACRAVYWRDGRFMGRRACNRDMTDRKVLERELRDLTGTLERRIDSELAKSREKDHILIQQSRLAAMGEMVHNIAHQWRQPLNGLAIIVANIKDDFDYGELTPERLDKSVTRVRQLLDSMSSTIDDFRNFFLPEREPVAFDLAKAVEQALLIMEASLVNNAITLYTALTPGLAGWGHANQFSQAVLNIVANAKEALQARKTEHGHISLRLEQRDDMAVLTIHDNGGGIAPEVLPRVFDPYFTTKDTGSGIGLYMTRTIIERNFQGRIELANEGDGTLVTIAVPLLTEESAAALAAGRQGDLP